jgi:hypothetical protein
VTREDIDVAKGSAGMNTRKLLESKGLPVCKADDLTAICEPII